MTSSSLSLLLVLGLAASTVACTASTSVDDTGSNDSDITGVTDLTEMESALGLQKDFKQPDGSWYRGDDKLKAGACYKQLIGGPDSASYQFRRYSTGASFFKKLGAGAASGDERPILCVDVDIERWDGAQSSTDSVTLNDFEIDSVIRYRLGAPQGSDGAAGSSYNQFVGGAVHYTNFYCYGDGPTFKFDPAAQSELSRHCMSGMMFPGSGGEIDGSGLLTVYQFARLKATETNRWSAEGDVVGRFIKVTGTWESPDQVVEFEKVDLHIVRNGETTKYQLAPHGQPGTSWFYECQVTSTKQGDAAIASCGGA